MSAEAVISWGVQTGFAVTLLVGIILIIRRPFSKYFGPKAAYALWALPVLRLFMPPLELAWLAPLKAAPPQTPQPSLPQDIFFMAQSLPTPSVVPSFWDSYSMISLIMLWAIGAVIFLLWHLRAQQKTTAFWVSQTVHPPHALSQMREEITIHVGLKTSPKLSLSAHISGPLVTGLRRPHIILPLDFSETFTAEEQYYALLHEITHIKRRDLYTSTLALLVRALNWPNPLVHLAARFFRADQEAACDASVLAYMPPEPSASTPHNRAYAQTLIKAAVQAQDRLPSGFAAPALTLTIHHPLKERLMTLSNPMPKSSLRHRLAATAIAATVLTLNAPISFVAASEAPQTELAGEPTPPAPPTVPHVTIEKDIRIIDGGKQTHLIHSRSDNNGVVQDRKVEISVEGDTVSAYEIDPVSGTRTQINPNTIEGYERITESHGQFKIDTKNGQIIRFEELEGEINDIISELHAEGKLDEDAVRKRIKVLRLDQNSDSNIWVDGDAVDGVEKRHFTFKVDRDGFSDGVDIENLLERHDFDAETIERIKVLKGGDTKIIFAGNEFLELDTAARLQAAESMLESVHTMLGDTEEASRELKKARKELQEVMKAVEKARTKIDSEK